MPDTKGGATNLASSMRRWPWFQTVCRHLNLNPDVHRDRVDAVTYALRTTAELLSTGAEPLARVTTRLLVAALRMDANERGARQELVRASQAYREALNGE